MERTTDSCWILDELVKARAYSRALRHMLNAGLGHLEPLTFDDELCEWNGPLLPLEKIDRLNYIPDHLVEHGTDRGYQWHRRRGEAACKSCRLAHNATTRVTKQEQRRSA